MSFFLRFRLIRNWYINRLYNERRSLEELRDTTSNIDVAQSCDADIARIDLCLHHLMVM